MKCLKDMVYDLMMWKKKININKIVTKFI